jgi:hypothetical protein
VRGRGRGGRGQGASKKKEKETDVHIHPKIHWRGKRKKRFFFWKFILKFLWNWTSAHKNFVLGELAQSSW